MKALLDSGMEAGLGKGLKIKSQDELIGKDGKFISRLSRRRRSRKASLSDNEEHDLFFDAESFSINFQVKKAVDDSNKSVKSSDYVAQDNKLNEDFSKRITELDQEVKEVTGQDEDVEVGNNKRKMVTQGNREDDV
jgi:hypothetical protein